MLELNMNSLRDLFGYTYEATAMETDDDWPLASVV